MLIASLVKEKANEIRMVLLTFEPMLVIPLHLVYILYAFPSCPRFSLTQEFPLLIILLALLLFFNCFFKTLNIGGLLIPMGIY